MALTLLHRLPDASHAVYDPFDPSTRTTDVRASGLVREINLDTGYIEDLMSFLQHTRFSVPSLKVTLARGGEASSLQIRGMAVGLYGKRFWVGYEYSSPTEVIATLQWQMGW